MDYANGVLQDILNNIANTNVAELLVRAEQILADISARDFIDQENAADDELRKAMQCESRGRGHG